MHDDTVSVAGNKVGERSARVGGHDYVSLIVICDHQLSLPARSNSVNRPGTSADLRCRQEFRAGAISCGIKNPNAERLDLALIVSDAPAVCDAVFTTNAVKAAPVRLCQQHLKAGSDIRAIIANSGNANACTGVVGIQHAKAIAWR